MSDFKKANKDWFRSPAKPVGDAIGLVALFDESTVSISSDSSLQQE